LAARLKSRSRRQEAWTGASFKKDLSLVTSAPAGNEFLNGRRIDRAKELTARDGRLLPPAEAVKPEYTGSAI